MIVDAAQLGHFKVVLGMTNHDSSLSKRHATPNVVNRQEEARVIRVVDRVHLIVLIEHATFDVINCQEEAHVVRDVNRVHLIVFIELEELHCVVLQSNLLFCFFRIHSRFMWWSSSSLLSTSSTPAKI
ncbi:unnamed protein product [Sphagnum jensenii]|uniref:Uncharacterized protein n=1 Tax=Sphagnum jensenii TaxID=128206 RepID=A0ABP0VXF9_9BRYO